mmetsp:Transcript_29309/g.72380  ORF Transcript_29309/g.72380 Transcript_29309/m.72380 type:complete len:200 (+) Transcript_29309:444-1043(+)
MLWGRSGRRRLLRTRRSTLCCLGMATLWRRGICRAVGTTRSGLTPGRSRAISSASWRATLWRMRARLRRARGTRWRSRSGQKSTTRPRRTGPWSRSSVPSNGTRTAGGGCMISISSTLLWWMTSTWAPWRTSRSTCSTRVWSLQRLSRPPTSATIVSKASSGTSTSTIGRATGSRAAIGSSSLSRRVLLCSETRSSRAT